MPFLTVVAKRIGPEGSEPEHTYLLNPQWIEWLEEQDNNTQISTTDGLLYTTAGGFTSNRIDALAEQHGWLMLIPTVCVNPALITVAYTTEVEPPEEVPPDMRAEEIVRQLRESTRLVLEFMTGNWYVYIAKKEEQPQVDQLLHTLESRP